MSKRKYTKKSFPVQVTPRRTPPGASPGTVVVDPDAPKPILRVAAYGPEQWVEDTLHQPADVKKFLGKYPVVWVDVSGLGDRAVLEELAEIFQLHPLALEDVAHVDQRAKVEQYGDHLLFIVARLIAQEERLKSEQVSLFLGPNFVLTFEEHPGPCFEPVRRRLRGGKGRLRVRGSDYLLYALLDAVIDTYFPFLEEFGERLDALDDDLSTRTAALTISKIHEARSLLLLLRRTIWPHREAINQLIRDTHPIVTDETRVFLRDCYDNVIQLIDFVETYRDLCADLRDECLSYMSNRLNEIMKVLTIIATIFMPLSFLGSLYGMNFNTAASPWNMPELNWRFGYPFVLGLMACVTVGMLFFFRRRGWLGNTSDEPPRERKG